MPTICAAAVDRRRELSIAVAQVGFLYRASVDLKLTTVDRQLGSPPTAMLDDDQTGSHNHVRAS
jgi:hypothetical protein